ncbi:MAG: IS91 family transposase, partial [Thermodesulfobacteriota bacterium]|nr:IS91 family transposase [Thermodesulfobacteriota bacterium]
MDECDHCGMLRISYNSCRNRHCPKCQSLDKERWIEARKRDLLPIRYFHIVFTLPKEMRPLALRNQKVIYNLFFKAISFTLRKLSRDRKYLGAEIGFIALLHTWTQTLMDHPHIHCIVTGGGLSLSGKRWVSSKKRFFVPVKVLSRLFRGTFLHYLRKAYDSGQLVFPGKVEELGEKASFKTLLSDLYKKEWVVYCKPPIKRLCDVIDYVGRYTHRVAITNDRIVKIEGDEVTIRFRDSSCNNKTRVMVLFASEFIRRFLLHMLPYQFMKIRHYGIFSNRSLKTKLLRCKELFGMGIDGTQQREERVSWEDVLLRITGVDPRCRKGRMVPKELPFPQYIRYPP